MKKILYGLTLIAFSLVLFTDEIQTLSIFEYGFVQVITVFLPIIGLAIATLGFFDKEDK